jgi:F-type H+-transporting ATPase subunit a
MDQTLDTTTTQPAIVTTTATPVAAAATSTVITTSDNPLYAEPIAYFHSFPITNSLITSWVAVLIIVALSLAVRLKMKKIPGKLQHFFEIMLEGGLNLADQVTGDRKITEKVFPLAICMFFFVLVNNWLGLIPLGGLGVLQHAADGTSAFVPFLRGGTADINTTLMLAIIAVIGSNIFGAMVIGIWKTFNRYVNVRALGQVFTKIRHEPTILVVAPVMFFVGLLELIGEIAKVASLSFRLFGNVFAGEVLLASMSALFAYGLPIPFMFLEVIVGAIQALIISMLVLVYFTISAQDHEAHEEHSEESVLPHPGENAHHGETQAGQA